MGQFFFLPNPWQKMPFLNPLDVMIPKIPFSFLCRFLGLGHLRGPGVRLGTILGVLSIEPFLGEGGAGQGALSNPPPPQLQARLPLGRSTAPSTEPFRLGHGGPTLRSMGGANAAGGAVCPEQK